MMMRRQMLLTGLGVADLVLVLLSLAVTMVATGTGVRLDGLLRLPMSVAEVLLLVGYLGYWHVALAAAGLYGSYRLASPTRELRDVACAAALAVLPVLPLAALLGYARVDLAFTAVFWAGSVAALAGGRRLLRGVGTLVRSATTSSR